MSDDLREVLLEHGNEILLLVDATSLAIRSANSAAIRHLGYAHESLLGRTIIDVETGLSDLFYWDDVRQGVITPLSDADTWFLRQDGELLPVRKSIVRAADDPTLLVVSAVPSAPQQATEDELADLSARLQATLEATADGILLLDCSNSILNMNRRFSQMWEIPETALLAHDDLAILDFMAGRMGDPAAYRARLAEIQEHGDAETRDTLSLANGQILEQTSRAAWYRSKSIGRVYSFTDVTERKSGESRLSLAASVFTHAHEGIVIVDANGSIVDVNDAFCRITGYSQEEAFGQDLSLFKSDRQNPGFYSEMWQALLAGGHWHGELWNRRKDGALYAEKLSISVANNINDEGRYFVCLFFDITELKQHQHQLEHMAHYDALTEIPNRVLLADRLELAIAQSRRRARSLAVVYLDLDGFKEINDLYGHEVGDQLLIAIAQRLRDALRAGDTLARLGGDEFVAVLADLGGENEWLGVLQRMQRAAAAPVMIRQHALQLTASFGVTVFPDDCSDPDTLLRHADQAMYQAKQAGKNRYQQFDPECDRQAQTLLETRRDVAQALAQGDFVLFYQPKVNMRTGAVVGAEALIRWQHRERGLLLPGEFLPLIEDDELIVQLGDWVMDAALDQISEWQSRGLRIPVSVNVAAYHLQQHDFLEKLKARLDAHLTVPPGMLELEVVETVALEGVAKISRLIEECRSLGVSFSLDDFGTGYSSLTYLRRLPASMLKIDQSFVRNMHWDSDDLSIVEGVIGLAGAFGRTVIAEGVETACHGELLLRLGCNLAQGYGIARPMPANAFPGWAENWRSEPAWRLGHNVAVTRDDLPLTHAEVDLLRWVRCIQSRSAETPYAGDQCAYRFGQWYDGDGRDRYGFLGGFAALAPLHEALKTLGDGLIALCEQGLASQARRRLEELHALHRSLIDKLHALLDESVDARMSLPGNASLLVRIQN